MKTKLYAKLARQIFQTWAFEQCAAQKEWRGVDDGDFGDRSDFGDRTPRPLYPSMAVIPNFVGDAR